MPPAPLTLALLMVVTTAVGAARLGFDPDPLSAGSGALAASGMIILTVVVTAGVLLARGRWARWTALGLGAAWIGIAAIGPLDVLGGILMAGAAATSVAAAGPWTARWFRKLPAADGPPPVAVATLLSMVATPAIAGIAAPDGPGWAGWSWAAWTLLLALGLAQALPAALWVGRLAHGPLTLAAAAIAGLPAAPVIVALGAIQTGMLWNRGLGLSVSPLMPTGADPVPIPPELVDPQILAAAGYDDSGRPVEKA